jgi:hypothetical protein
MGISIVNSQIVWAENKTYANLYRTVDGGDVWDEAAPSVNGAGDIDDINALNADMVWSVQNQGGAGGRIIRVGMVNGEVISDSTDPMNSKYQYEGITCFDEKTVWMVGYKARSVPEGVTPAYQRRHNVDEPALAGQRRRIVEGLVRRSSSIGSSHPAGKYFLRGQHG